MIVSMVITKCIVFIEGLQVLGPSIWNPHSNYVENAIKLFSQVYITQGFRVLYIHFWLIYHRFCKNYLFLPVAFYKTTTDQNVYTVWRNPLHILYWDLPYRLLSLVENFTKSEVSVRKKTGCQPCQYPKHLYEVYR